MSTLFGKPWAIVFGQLLLGIINGSVYAMLCLGLSLIFGMLRVINFAHGAQYMLGAFFAWALMKYAGLGFWWALILSPLAVAAIGVLIERGLLARTYGLDHINTFLLSLGIALVIEGVVRYGFGNAVRPYPTPEELKGAYNLGFIVIPVYRGFVVLVSMLLCTVIWLAIEKTKVGGYLRASTEDATLVQLFGVNVPLLMTATYAAGVALAALGGVLAAPVFQVTPLMGEDLIIVVFAIVVIGGVGSILGTVISGFGLGILEGVTNIFYPAGSGVVVFVIMAIVLLVRPSGLFGRE